MNDFVELLAPAGSYEAFLGALNAGADAVYLGGDRFGARAYAENLETKEICRALHIAHFYGKKIYLTVNTLLKERELSGLSDYLTPFYEAGLDGVIVQDLGVFRYIRERFPDLPLHGSTQMTVTGWRGAAFLKEQGAVRIVPARELSLEEVRRIKAETGMAVECFIHGAMCYCYSGQCLFSSILGGRSGNRGRCAQPCRLSYEIYDGKQRISGESYPLSLKDMCTLEYLPALIGAGIDSFKIEGRMKRPEYAAGVTAVYRKYIDLYYREGAAGYRVDPADMDRLRGLYIRSEIQTGYYERHNGSEMITLEKPGYRGSDEALLARVRADYLHEPEKMPVQMQAYVQVGEPLRLKMWLQKEKEAPLHDGTAGDRRKEAGTAVEVEVTGEIVQAAKNAPLTEADIRKQLTKTGDSLLTVTDCEVSLEGAGFVPIRALNQLRREAVDRLERAVIEGQKERTRKRDKIRGNEHNRLSRSTKNNQVSMPVSALVPKDDTSETCRMVQPAKDCLVTTYEQLEAVAEADCRRIYVESDLLLAEPDRIVSILGRQDKSCYYPALPYILRDRDEQYLERLEAMLSECGKLFSGVLVRNLEGLSYVWSLAEKEEGDFRADGIIADAGLYCFNTEAAGFLQTYCREITLPYELNAGEAAHLAKAARKLGLSVNQIAYSRIPMMITANCLQKTAGRCLAGKGKRLSLKDRHGEAFPVVLNCEHCYNVIYNVVPYSLHAAKKERERIGAAALRYDFVLENGTQCRQILKGEYPFAEHTTGHCKRGIV